MSTNEIILAVVCGVLVVSSLAAALVLPRRDPGFPGRNLGAFFLDALGLVGGTLAAVEVLGTEEEVEAATPAETQPRETETSAPETALPPETAGDPVAGKEVFAAAGCAGCHTLADAGATGAVGPSLDASKPAPELVVELVTNGRGAMPALSQLSEQEIADVAAYVAQATGG